MDRLLEIAESIADTETTAYLLQQDFVIFGLAAIALLGLLSGAIGPFIIMRQMSFSVHGASELYYEVFGDAGRHARSAVGVPVLPLDAPVEVEMVVEVA